MVVLFTNVSAQLWKSTNGEGETRKLRKEHKELLGAQVLLNRSKFKKLDRWLVRFLEFQLKDVKDVKDVKDIEHIEEVEEAEDVEEVEDIEVSGKQEKGVEKTSYKKIMQCSIL